MTKPLKANRTFLPCQSCRELAYYLEHDRVTGLGHFTCRTCGHELMAVQVAAPKEREVTVI